MTPEERAEHKRAQDRERQRKKREREQPARESMIILRELEREIERDAMARENMADVRLTPELEEFADELLTKSMAVAALALAMWEKENRAIFPDLPKPDFEKVQGNAALAEYFRLKDRWRKFRVIRYFAITAIQELNRREARERSLAKELVEARGHDMGVDTYRAFKRRQRAAKRAEIDKEKERAA